MPNSNRSVGSLTYHKGSAACATANTLDYQKISEPISAPVDTGCVSGGADDNFLTGPSSSCTACAQFELSTISNVQTLTAMTVRSRVWKSGTKSATVTVEVHKADGTLVGTAVSHSLTASVTNYSYSLSGLTLYQADVDGLYVSINETISGTGTTTTERLSTINVDATYGLVNTAPPAATGLFVFGQPLSVAPGTWTGFPSGVTVTRTYQWQRCSSTDISSCVNISGATGTNYTPGFDDEQAGLRVAETVSDGIGDPATAYSSATAPIGITSPADPCSPDLNRTLPAGCSADPVDDATGALSESMTDVSLPGPGGGWSFSRSYYSNATTSSSILGPGWTVGLNASLSIDPISGDVTFNDEVGSSIPYTALGDDAFTPAVPGVTSALAENMDGSYTVTRQDGTAYSFSSTGVWSSLCDRNGNCTTFTRNTDGNVTSLVDPAGRSITFDYTGTGSSTRLEDINLPGSHQVTYAYDTNGNLASVTNIEGDETQYTYDSSHRITDKYDGNGHHVYHNVYDTTGRITSQTNALGYTTTFAWNATTQVETTTDARSKQWTSYYAGNVLQKRVDPLGNATTYTYNSQLLPTKIVPPTGHATTMTYDSSGNMLTRTNVDAGTTETWSGYNAFNEPGSYVDGRGKTTTYSYDTHGNLLRVIDPLDHATDMVYDSHGLVLTKTAGETYDPGTNSVSGGEMTTYTYTDGTGGTNVGDLASVTEPEQTTGGIEPETTYTYDALGRPVTVTSPRGNLSGATRADYTTTTTYNDSADTVTTTTPTEPVATQTVTDYDHAGNRLSVKTTSGSTVLSATEGVYDAGDRLTKLCPQLETDCAGTTGPKTTFDYDQVGDLTTRTDANGKATAYVYDDADELVSATTAAGHETSHTYVHGQLATTTDALGNSTPTPTTDGTTTFGYDAYGNLSSRDYSDSGTPDVSYVFDAAGNRTKMIDGRGTTTYAYDDAGQLTDVCPSGASNCAGTTDAKSAYTYDGLGQVTGRSYPDGTTATYTYWPDGELHQVSQGGLTASFFYDADGNPIEVDHGNGLIETRAYDHAGRLTQIKTMNGTTVTYQADYTLDGLGRPTKVVRTGDQDITWSYSYDAQGRLTDACRQAETDCHGSSDPKLSYTYDSMGNRLTSTDLSGSTTTYAYDTGGDNELTGVTHPDTSTTSYSYDADGRQTATGATTYVYSQAGQLTGVTTTGVTGAVSFTYDGDGNRLTQNDTRAGGQDVAYNWDVNGALPELESEHDASTGAVVRSYTRAGATPLWMQTAGSSSTTTYDYQTDELGSVTQLMDQTGGQACTYAYAAYGESDGSAAGGGTDCATGVSASLNPIRYAGEAQDATGLYDLRAREYDPTVGRFLATDPVASEQPEVNAYSYARDLPSALTDPSGLCPGCKTPWAGRSIVGLCGGAGFMLYTVGAQGQVCVPVVVSGHWWNPVSWRVHDIGLTTSEGGTQGIGLYGGGSLNLLISNAGDISEMRGQSVGASGTAEVADVGADVESTFSHGCGGRLINTTEVGWSPGFGAGGGAVLNGTQVHAGGHSCR